MLYLHPVGQITAILLCLYALWLGWARFRSLHLGRKTRFQRQRHALAGGLGLGLMTLGVFGGLIMARLYFGGWLLTGEHGVVGLAMLPFLVFGLASGWVLHQRPGPRKLLPLLHGLNNLWVLALAFYQIGEGAEVIEHFVRGL